MTMKMTKEERIIRHMRRRWPGITAASVMLIVCFACLCFAIRQNIKVAALVTPERVAAMASFDNPKAELPELFCRFHSLAACSAKLMFYEMYFASLAGAALAFLIVQVADVTNRRLFLSMLDRLQKLEKQGEVVKPPQKSDSQPPPAE